MHEERKQWLADFVSWVADHIKGDEKGEAQIFLDRLFVAFGHKGVKEAGATLEQRVKKADNRGTAFADLVWKPIVLIEMKRRGEDLNRHYRQAFDYWTRLVPGRPRYVVLQLRRVLGLRLRNADGRARGPAGPGGPAEAMGAAGLHVPRARAAGLRQRP